MNTVQAKAIKRGDVVRVAEGEPKVLVKSVAKVGSFIQVCAFGTTDRWYVAPEAEVEQEQLTFTVDELVCFND